MTYKKLNVLNTIRLLLDTEGKATRTSIKQISPHLTNRHILETIAANKEYISFNKNAIIRVNVTAPLKQQLWNSGKFYRKNTYGAWSVEGYCLEFEGNLDLRRKLESSVRIGSLGDSWDTKIIHYTDNNVKALEDAGLADWSTAVIDDQLWKEKE